MPALTIPVIKQPVTDEPIIKEDDDEFGKRKPSRPITCSISSDGVVIAGVEDEILSFEIAYSEDGGCLLCTDDEQEFIEVLATLPADTYQIVFLTEDYRYVGYLEL
ncbi:MAG: hypothetical protein K2G35_00445 [Duncaniella sp.]|nr:hypothetical protein [Duncaniella sp.]